MKRFPARLLPGFLFAASLSAEPADSPQQQAVPPIEPTVVAYTDYQDPFQPFNRAMFAFNDAAFRYALIPLSKGYIKAVPKPARRGINNVFSNLKLPLSAVNHLLQFKPGRAGQNLTRFAINSTIGIAGIFDPATDDFDMAILDTNFGDTLGRYGAGYGAYIVLPLFGPTDFRSGTGTIVDYFFHPVTYFAESPESTIINGFDYFQDFAPSAESYLKLRAKSDEPYVFFRNFYLQGIQRDVDYEKKAE